MLSKSINAIFLTGSDDGEHFLVIKSFLIKVCTLCFRHNGIALLIDYSINFICSGWKTRTFTGLTLWLSLYCSGLGPHLPHLRGEPAPCLHVTSLPPTVPEHRGVESPQWETLRTPSANVSSQEKDVQERVKHERKETLQSDFTPLPDLLGGNVSIYIPFRTTHKVLNQGELAPSIPSDNTLTT